MEIQVQGQTPLYGTVEVGSSKNAILPILAASLLTDEPRKINRIPNIKDVEVITEVLSSLGVNIDQFSRSLEFFGGINSNHPPYELVRQIRASFLVMGPLLARRGNVRVALPGGCAIGTRPIDLHLKGFEALGAKITMSGGDVIAKANILHGNHIP